ncbi:cysteine proteinase [Hysterangium stoloniferum]|nr:cysteine proteinase [Hysterangium stoloniferum]
MADAEKLKDTIPKLSKRQLKKKNKGLGIGLRKAQSGSHIYKQERSRAGILVTAKFFEAVERCKARVKEIADECRSNNLKFRDHEFDLAGNRELCLHSLGGDDVGSLFPADVLRISQIFEKPQFMTDGAKPSDIEQGKVLGDCWFLAALAMLASMPGLLEKICVERDEKAGVYGFVFCRDGEWEDVIIDEYVRLYDMKFALIYELFPPGQNLYHDDKYLYQKIARRGSKTLYFARSAQENETWVPLIEKAYAKFHGDYESLNGGSTCEALEDMTGFVSIRPSFDIIDPDDFWHNNLKLVGTDRLFECHMGSDGEVHIGLIGNHAYSILAAKAYNGKRFVKIRNPWGKGEWTGRWSDGSSEWTDEWRPALKLLEHGPKQDGSFIMEYEDFLNTWEEIERVQLFNDKWIQSAHWLNVKTRPPPAVWQYGDVSFTFTLAKASRAMIVLSQADSRFWKGLVWSFNWSFDFIVFKRDQSKIIGRSRVPSNTRSVSVTKYLTEGEYFVHVRPLFLISGWDGQKRKRVHSQYAHSQSIAANYDSTWSEFMVIPEKHLAKGDLLQLEIAHYEETIEKRQTIKAAVFPRPAPTTSTSDTREDTTGSGNADTPGDEIPHGNNNKDMNEGPTHSKPREQDVAGEEEDSPKPASEGEVNEGHRCKHCKTSLIDGVLWWCLVCSLTAFCDACHSKGLHPADHRMVKAENSADAAVFIDQDDGCGGGNILLGLRVYTEDEAKVDINGQLRHGNMLSWAKEM